MLYHGSHSENLKADFKVGNGVFGSFMFFMASDPEAGSEFGPHLYSIDEDKLNICESCWAMTRDEDWNGKCNELLSNLAEYLDVDEDTAMELIAEETTLVKLDIFDGEDAWHLQTVQATIAKAMGYDGLRVVDENGTVYMIDMEKNINKLEA